MKRKPVSRSKQSDGSPHPVDIHVGLRIRLRRNELNVVQESLAEALGISFQQIQKYESGHNRVSASRLYAMANALETTTSYFFDGLDAPESQSSTYAPEAMTMIRNYMQLPEHARQAVKALAQVLREQNLNRIAA